MTVEHLVIPPVLAVLGVGIPAAIFDGEYEAAIVAGLVVILVKMGDVIVDKINGKKPGNGGVQCVVHAAQVTDILHEVRGAIKDLHASSESLNRLVGKLETLTNFVRPRMED